MSDQEIIYKFSATGADRVISSVKNINNENQLLARFLRDLQTAFGLSEKAAANYARSLGITGSSLSAYQKAIDRADKETREFAASQGQLQKSVRKSGDDIGFLASQYLEATRAFATRFLQTAVTDAIDATKKFDAIRAVLSNVTSSASEADATFQFLSATSNKFGQDIEASARSFGKLQGSIQNLDISKKLFEGIAAASSTFKLTQDETNGALLALSQIASKGAIQMEELRGQLGERLPGALRLVAEALGTTTAELEDFIRNNRENLPAQLDAIGQKLIDTYGVKGVKAADGLVGAQARLNNSFKALLDSIGQKLVPVFRSLTDTATTAIAQFRALPEELQQLILVAVALAAAMATLALSVGAVSIAIPALIAAFKGGLAAMAAFSTGALPVIAALAAIGFAVLDLIKTFKFENLLVELDSLQVGLDALSQKAVNSAATTQGAIDRINQKRKEGLAISQQELDQAKKQEAANKIIIEANRAQIAAIDEKIAKFKEENGLQDENAKTLLDQVANVASLGSVQTDFNAKNRAYLESLRAQKSGLEANTVQLEKKNTTLSKLTTTTKSATQTADEFTDANARQLAVLDSQSAKRQASILENVKNEKEANRLILEDEIATAQKRLSQANLLVVQLTKLESQSKGKAREEAETKLTAAINAQSKERINIAKLEAQQRREVEEELLKKLDESNKKALQAIDTSSKFRIEQVKRESLKSVEAKQQEAAAIAQIELTASKARLTLVQQEQTQLLALRSKISGEEFNKRQLELETQKSNALLQIAREETEALKAEQEKRLAQVNQFYDDALDIAKNKKLSLEVDLESLDSQKNLLESQLSILESQSEIKRKDLELDIQKLDNLIEQSDQYTNQGSLIAQRDAKQKALFDEEKAFLKTKQDLEKQIFELKSNQLRIEAQVKISQQEINVLEAQRLVATLAATRASAAQIAQALEGVKIAERALAIAQQNAQNVEGQINKNRELLGLKQEQEKKELAIAQAAKAKEQADKVAVANAQKLANETSKIADNTEKAGESTKSLVAKLSDARIAYAAITDELGRIIALSTRTEDPNKLLKERLELEVRLAKTEEEKAKKQAQLDALDRQSDEEKLKNLNKEIALNNTLLKLREEQTRRANAPGLLPVTLPNELRRPAPTIPEEFRIRPRFQGGDVTGNQPYLVGEDPNTGRMLPSSEVFIPKTSGYVMSANKLAEFLDKGLPSNSVKAPVEIATSNTSRRSPNYLANIDRGIAKLTREVSDMQPKIEEVNINAPLEQSGELVYKMLTAQLKASLR